jgi:hypothetical protein
MRVFVLLVWLMVPVVALAYHLGPGQELKSLDEAGDLLREINRTAAAEHWDEVIELCDRALARLPKDRIALQRRLVLERAKARMLAHQLPTAHDELEGLVDDLRSDEKADAALLTEAQASLANAQYYMTWLKRLEGKPREEWEPDIEASRQTYRLLAEHFNRSGDTAAAKRCQEDLESAIRLARMDLKELQGLPLPSQ